MNSTNWGKNDIRRHSRNNGFIVDKQRREHINYISSAKSTIDTRKLRPSCHLKQSELKTKHDSSGPTKNIKITRSSTSVVYRPPTFINSNVRSLNEEARRNEKKRISIENSRLADRLERTQSSFGRHDVTKKSSGQTQRLPINNKQQQVNNDMKRHIGLRNTDNVRINEVRGHNDVE